MTERTCRELGGFDPDIRHRTNDSVTSLALVAGGQAVTLLPALVDPNPDTRPGVAVRAIAEGSVHRTIFAATRSADAERPSVQALLAAVRGAAAALGPPAPGRSLPGAFLAEPMDRTPARLSVQFSEST